MRHSTIALFLSLIAVLSITGCSQPGENSNGMTTVYGTIQHPGGDKIYFYSYADTFEMYRDVKSAIDSSIPDKNGNYRLTNHGLAACAFDLKYGNNILLTNLFLPKGQNIKIDFYGRSYNPEIFPSGEAEKFNNFLIRFADKFYKDPDTKHIYYISTNYMDVSTFTEYNNKRKQKQLEFFENTFMNDTLSREFRNYATNTINYGIAVDRLMYLWKKRMKGENISVDSSFFEFETPAFIENKDALNCPAYTRFLYLYIKDTYERMVDTGKLPAMKGGKLIPQVEKYLLARKLLHRPFFDVVFYNIVLNDRDVLSMEDLGSLSSKTPVDLLINLFEIKYSLNKADDSSSNE